ncbi:MAG: outer membrane receptor protein involved in Fe transport, partial [Arcticibacterium sp.]
MLEKFINSQAISISLLHKQINLKIMVRNFTFVRAGLLALVVLMTTSAFAQSVISGTIMDGSNNEPLIGASISVKGTSIGTTSDVDGKYTLNGVPAGSETLVVSFIGFFRQQVTIGSQSVINLTLAADASILGEIIVIGASDIAIDRQTPVALSNITSIDIEEKGGNQEFPELMKSTPSVYATKTGGGYGDSRISVRGFDQVNTAVLINGQPVNDMENGRVYWSNWA